MFIGLTAKNFRAFRELSFFPSRLTTVLGPNSSGKSSIIQLIRLLSQTATVSDANGESRQFPLSISGPDFSILDPMELFSDGDPDRSLEINCHFQINNHADIDTSRWLRSVYELTTLFQRVGLSSPNFGVRRSSRGRDNASKLFELEMEMQRYTSRSGAASFPSIDKALMEMEEIIGSTYDDLLSLDDKMSRQIWELIVQSSPYSASGESRLDKNPHHAKENLRQVQLSSLRDEIISSLQMIHKILVLLQRKTVLRFNFCLGIREVLGGQSSAQIYLRSHSMTLGDTVLYEVATKDGDDQDKIDGRPFSSAKIGWKDGFLAVKDASNFFDLRRNVFRVLDPRSRFMSFVVWVPIVKSFIDFTQRCMIKIAPVCIGPYRYRPSSVYILPELQKSSDYMVEVVRRNAGNDSVRVKLNALAERFGFHVQFPRFLESIYSVSIATVSDQPDDERYHHAGSVGFGLVHLLPILDCLVSSEAGDMEQASASNKSHRQMLFIEQPEAHLHPKMHSELADMLLRFVMKNPKFTLIVETHSDHFLSRLARRMRRLGNQQDGVQGGMAEFTSSDISVIYVSRVGSGFSSIQNLIEDERDGFLLPDDFIEGKAADQLNDLAPLFDIR